MESVAILSPQLYESLQSFRRNRRAKAHPSVILPVQFGSLKRCRDSAREEQEIQDKRMRACETQREEKESVIVMNLPRNPRETKKDDKAGNYLSPAQKIFISSKGGELKEGSSKAMLDSPWLSATPPNTPSPETVTTKASADTTNSFMLVRDDSLNSEPGLPSEDDIDLLFDESANMFDSTNLKNFNSEEISKPTMDTITLY
eukprot:CAMPEP_0184486800 /NCGR_PEP_ID=MMETSP0113_2-20130426/8669_1 /TAXON_ID=91329 /ORGANISM="Norrisiella sphaerica, Strain BC52" /LENGTH=201 /DNA_ID=CAMNT_0026868849 /DNA_START=25 /DNA_END=630 /DNA_ORIENTATION=+